MVGPDGQQWYAITCSHGADNCWEEAQERCPNGYVTDKDHQATTTEAFGSSHSFTAHPAHKGQLLVKCK